MVIELVEVTCQECQGKGYKPYPVSIDYATIILIKQWCEKCRGKGVTSES